MSTAFDYSGMLATANKLINKFGRNLTLRTYTNSGTAYEPSLSYVESTVKGVVVEVSNEEIDRNGLINRHTDMQIATQLKKIYLRSDSTISQDDKIVDESNTYSVIAISPINPGATLICYEVFVMV